jgi:hypothetical protein
MMHESIIRPYILCPSVSRTARSLWDRNWIAWYETIALNNIEENHLLRQPSQNSDTTDYGHHAITVRSLVIGAITEQKQCLRRLRADF